MSGVGAVEAGGAPVKEGGGCPRWRYYRVLTILCTALEFSPSTDPHFFI